MLLERLLLFLIHTHIWISLGVVSLYLASCRIMSVDIDISYILLLFSATTLSYALNRLLSGDAPKQYIFPSIIAACFLGIVSLWLGSSSHLISLVIPAMVTLSYIMARINKLFSVRSVDWLKPASIAFTWAWVTVLPGFDFSIPAFLTFLYVLSLVWSLSIIFDLKDIEIDKARGFYTLPQKYNEHRVKILALSVLSIAIISIIVLYGYHEINLHILLIICLLITIQSTCIFYTHRHAGILWFYGLLDGLLILPGFIFLL